MSQLNLGALSGLPPQDRDLLFSLARKSPREAPARRDLLREGEAPRGVLVLLEGWACRYKRLPDGRWHELALTAIAREWVLNVGQRNAYERVATCSARSSTIA